MQSIVDVMRRYIITCHEESHHLTIYNIGQAKGFIYIYIYILVVAFTSNLIATRLNEDPCDDCYNQHNPGIVSPDIVKQVVLDQLSPTSSVLCGNSDFGLPAVIWSRENGAARPIYLSPFNFPGSRFGIYWAKLLTMLVIILLLPFAGWGNPIPHKLLIPEFYQYHATMVARINLAMPLLSATICGAVLPFIFDDGDSPSSHLVFQLLAILSFGAGEEGTFVAGNFGRPLF